MDKFKRSIHIPVLLQDLISKLNFKNGLVVLDGTLGGGGHAVGIIPKIMPDGVYIGIDWDKDILKETENYLHKRFYKYKKRIICINSNYIYADDVIHKYGYRSVDRIVADLGFSSWHINNSKRGFSFNSDEILDMRYDIDSGMPAYQIINSFSKNDLENIFWKYGEEKNSKKIAEAIIKERKTNKILYANQLSSLINNVVTKRRKKKLNPSTKVFQALRIYVNDELRNISRFLNLIPKILKKNGLAAIISFHSLEDRLVKLSFKKFAHDFGAEIITKKPLIPSDEEILKNVSSRSAKLRIIKM